MPYMNTPMYMQIYTLSLWIRIMTSFLQQNQINVLTPKYVSTFHWPLPQSEEPTSLVFSVSFKECQPGSMTNHHEEQHLLSMVKTHGERLKLLWTSTKQVHYSPLSHLSHSLEMNFKRPKKRQRANTHSLMYKIIINLTSVSNLLLSIKK